MTKGGHGQTAGKETTERYKFHFDGTLHDASQEEVYESCASELMDSFLQGINCTIMCYGCVADSRDTGP